MPTYSRQSRRKLLWCEACDAAVMAETDGGRADANAVCGSCGLAVNDSAGSGGDYFDVIMRVGRPAARARLRRPG